MAENPTEVTTPSAFFEELLPQGFAAQGAENPNPEDVVLQYNVSGDGGGQWTVKIAGGKMTVERGAAAAALLTFSLASADLLDAINTRNGAAPGLVIPAPQRGGSSGAVKALRGTMALNLTRPTADPFKLEMMFNGAAQPRTEMTIALSDHLLIQEGKMNGQEAFMTGKMRVTGDMGFLMQVGMATAR
jgi:SCP-2 sterol transfer family protein